MLILRWFKRVVFTGFKFMIVLSFCAGFIHVISCSQGDYMVIADFSGFFSVVDILVVVVVAVADVGKQRC